ncbi:glutamate 5-kinase [Hominifimenecus sp. rT4P-3]|uniref:glutamate 5-kinase n=1 Tax=Hominifimenecus sp. rT4P-3 TaxID=3242979 RepID=UPI003DA6B06A
MNCFQESRRIVIKIGSSTLTHKSGHINIRRMEQIVKILSDIHNSGKDLILVSSGAIAVGVGKLGLRERPSDTASKQAAAAVGQCELMYLYDKMFAEYNHSVSQVLMTRDIIEDEHRKQNAMNAFRRLIDFGTIPIVNENDTVAVDEIEFGDNDTLSAIVAKLTGADVLVLMSDIDGLYSGNPRTNPDVQLIPKVEKITPEIESIAEEAGSSRGTGGMITKIHAAQIAVEAGIDMAIINGEHPEQLYQLFDGETVGTHFTARRNDPEGE